MRFCSRCPLPAAVIAEDEQALEYAAVMGGALSAGADPLVAAIVHVRSRVLLSGADLASLAIARLFLRLQRGAALYDSMPAKLRSAA